MQQVLARRDDNWKKLQQYILDERERVELRGPARITLWGEQRDYTWYIRDGFFVRSPLKVNGAAVGDDRPPEVRGRLPQARAAARRAGQGRAAASAGPAATAPAERRTTRRAISTA